MARIDRIVLHIGKRKTGSTSIQASLHGVNRDGFRYADLPKPNHSRVMLGLVDRLMNRERRRATDTAPAAIDERRAVRLREIEDAIGETPARLVLFSAESLERVTGEEAGRVADFFSRFTDRVEVIGFVRPPRSAQISQFQERVKHGYAKTELPSPIYRATFQPWVDRLGCEKVRILPFVPGQFMDGSLLRTFLGALGEPDLAVPEIRCNDGMSGAAVKALFAFNRMSGGRANPDYSPDTQLALARHLVRALPGDKLTVPQDCHPTGTLGEEVAWLKATAGIDFSADLDGTNLHRNEASARLEVELKAITSEAVRQLRDYAFRRTGLLAAALEGALRDLHAATRAAAPGPALRQA